jgi:hypothetical protein
MVERRSGKGAGGAMPITKEPRPADHLIPAKPIPAKPRSYNTLAVISERGMRASDRGYACFQQYTHAR